MEILLDTLKWSAVVGAAALVMTSLKPLLDRRYRPKWRYGAWLVLAALLLLAPIQWGAFLPEAPAPAVVIEVPRMEVSVSRDEGLRIQTPAAVLPGGAPEGTVPAAMPGRALELERVLTILWLAGAAVFALYHLAGTLFFQRRARRWSRAPGEETLQVYEEVRREMGLRKAPPLRLSAQVDSPMLTGLFQPCLLLPADDFGRRELSFILRHELTHWRRNDLWYKLVLLLANAVHWFNPLVYLMNREAARDIELTCDALVVAGTDAATRRAYSETLLASIHRQKGFSGRSALTTHFYGGAEVMKERFRHILGKQGRKWGGIVLTLTLLATVATACAVGISQAEGPESLSREELDAWQEKLTSDPELEPYLRRMYTDPAYVPSEEFLNSLQELEADAISLGYEDLDLTVISGVQDGGTVTLELEGNFLTRLPSGTLTLVDEKPVSLTTPLYTAVEKMAWDVIDADAAWQGVEAADRRVTNLYCAESFQLENKTWYIWELYYLLKPADMGQVTLAGGQEERNGWVTDYNNPILVVSVDSEGSTVLEETTHNNDHDHGLTWEDYVRLRVLPEDPIVPEEPEMPADDPPGSSQGDENQPGELTPEELASFAAYFNPGEEPTPDSRARNGLLRFPYENFGGIRHYLEILFYDAGEGVMDEEERAALEERMNAPIDVDCMRLTRDFIREFLTWNFAENISEDTMAELMAEDISLPNLPEYDAFYLIHGDTMMNFYEFDRGVREADGTVKLYYTTDLYVYKGDGELDILWDQPMCAAMRPTGNDTWGMVSNTIVE